MKSQPFDVVVIGGGLAGIAASYRLAMFGKSVALVDDSLPAAKGLLGGFAKFSGAKFSLVPAGRGLIPVAGSEQKLEVITADVLSFLGLLYGHLLGSPEIRADKTLTRGLAHRSYQSIVLTPDEIDILLQRLTGLLPRSVSIARAKINRVFMEDNKWHVISNSGEELISPSAIYAGGRAANFLLLNAGAEVQNGKGLDVGVRVEFLDKRALDPLRALGPDAKILHERCRTFCLNSPGKVYRYEYDNISIPGGVVAESTHPSANVGLLYRSPARLELRGRIREKLSGMTREEYEHSPTTQGDALGDKERMISSIYGKDIASDLLEFAQLLGTSRIVDWDAPHKVHFPLLDWHWDTFAVGASHRTTCPGLWVAGDSAGHARGLLQAAISGWLAAQEVVGHECK